MLYPWPLIEEKRSEEVKRGGEKRGDTGGGAWSINIDDAREKEEGRKGEKHIGEERRGEESNI